MAQWQHSSPGSASRLSRSSGCSPSAMAWQWRTNDTSLGDETLNIQFILAVAAGGALGAVIRYLVGIGSARLFGTDFPWGTLITNVTGSFLIGIFAALFATRWNLPQAARIFLTVGICGGYTT